MDDNTFINQINQLRNELDRVSYSLQQQIDMPGFDNITGGSFLIYGIN
jgi:hypothetical protein